MKSIPNNTYQTIHTKPDRTRSNDVNDDNDMDGDGEIDISFPK